MNGEHSLADALRTYVSETLRGHIQALRQRENEAIGSKTYDGEFGYRAYALEMVQQDLADLLGTWDTTRPTTAAEILHGRRRAAVIAHASPSRVYDVPSQILDPNEARSCAACGRDGAMVGVGLLHGVELWAHDHCVETVRFRIRCAAPG